MDSSVALKSSGENDHELSLTRLNLRTNVSGLSINKSTS